MLAGASGIDAVLLVIAADESIKPQTREHFDICRLLGIRRGIIVLTKSDLVDPDVLGLARLEAEEFVQQSFLAGAPIIPVSATAGVGLHELRSALAALKATAKDATRFPRLPIDRSFSMKGHGAVVTGTLIEGTLALQDEVELYPTSKRAKIRGLQVHGKSVERARAGERTAVNLAGIDSAEIERGSTLAPPGIFRATRQIDTMFDLLPGAYPLKHRAPVHLHAGTAEIEAQARLIASLDPVKPGTRAHVRFALRDPLLFLPGDRFIVRMFSPVVTIGGGVVLDIDAPPRIRRADLDRRLTELESGDRVSILVSESKFGMGVSELIARTGLRKIDTPPSIVRLPNEWLISKSALDRLTAAIRDTLTDFHRKNPLQPGMQKEELRSRVLSNAPPFLLDALTGFVIEGDIVRLATHRVALKQDEEEATAKIEALFRDAGLAVPATTEVLAKSGIESARARSLLQILLKNRKLVRVGDELIFHHTALAQLRSLLASRKGTRFSVGEFKDWTRISRKYAIPLLEFLDRERLTRRDGESRIIV
jgi:selenocysteine-specific elongation factor